MLCCVAWVYATYLCLSIKARITITNFKRDYLLKMVKAALCEQHRHPNKDLFCLSDIPEPFSWGLVHQIYLSWHSIVLTSHLFTLTLHFLPGRWFMLCRSGLVWNSCLLFCTGGMVRTVGLIVPSWCELENQTKVFKTAREPFTLESCDSVAVSKGSFNWTKQRDN